MPSMQVDMFEVQLGAAILLQFRCADDQVVSVLADAGVTAGGYSKDHVQKKLPNVFNNFSTEPHRIDLMVGTHYDADHLEGLVPIIEDPSIEIGEVWMPPVANDTAPDADEDMPSETNMLVSYFLGEEGENNLHQYIEIKINECMELFNDDVGEFRENRRLERSILNNVIEENGGSFLEAIWDLRNQREDDYDAQISEKFQRVVRTADALLNETDSVHANDSIELPLNETDLGAVVHFSLRRILDDRSGSRKIGEEISLAMVARSAAKDAINAKSLAKVVKALEKRGVPIKCQIIPDGSPRRFAWKTKSKKFVPGDRLASEGPVLNLLGPSKGLVKKYWDRLPIGDYSMVAKFTTIPLKSITPSNQLSYVIKFDFEEQGILIAGDAGCVDFNLSRGSRTYHQPLLDALTPLHIIQVAHHAGNNDHFYRVLLAAKYAEQKEKSLLLLSHATDDKHRPSDEFGNFIENVRQDGDDIQLLFTSRPQKPKVDDFLDIIHSPVGTVNDVGDVRVEFKDSAWQVKSHAVEVT